MASWPLFPTSIDRNGGDLRLQVMRVLTAAIERCELRPGTRAPSSRSLSKLLGVSRTTANAAIADLVEKGILETRERSGCFVAKRNFAPAHPLSQIIDRSVVDWNARLATVADDDDQRRSPTTLYNFVYGQFDPTLFPVNRWRECERRALKVTEIESWGRDVGDADDPELVAQLIAEVLPRRGIVASPHEIIVTLGGQHGRYLVAQLLCGRDTATGMEEPGMRDMANVLRMTPTLIVPLPLDEEGLVPGQALSTCDTVFTTPGHQCPTTAVMPEARRRELLAQAERDDFVIVEDTFDTDLIRESSPSLYALQAGGTRVIHIGSMSKLMAPGLRIGFVVAPPLVIQRLRAIRRLMHRHPPGNNQRALAIFLNLGFYNAFLSHAGSIIRERAMAMKAALEGELPNLRWQHRSGASTFWTRLPPGLSSVRVIEEARRLGVELRSGDRYFLMPPAGASYLQLAVSSLPVEAIDGGLSRLADAIRTASL